MPFKVLKCRFTLNIYFEEKNYKFNLSFVSDLSDWSSSEDDAEGEAFRRDIQIGQKPEEDSRLHLLV